MKHDDPAMLEALDRAWDPEAGPLGLLREGIYDAQLADAYLALLDSIEIGEGERLHADFVKLVWFAPIFTEWQIERAAKRGADRNDVVNFGGRVCSRVMHILGMP